MRRVAVLTENVTEIPKELAEEYNIKLAPVNIVIDGKSYPDDEIDHAAREVTALGNRRYEISQSTHCARSNCRSLFRGSEFAKRIGLPGQAVGKQPEAAGPGDPDKPARQADQA